MGQKDYLFKHSPWEESTRIPLVVRVPGVAEHPVSLIDLYPTPVDLCDLKGDTFKNKKGLPLDGHRVRQFLKNPKTEEWAGPNGALTTIFAYNSKRFDELKRENFDPDNQHWVYRTKRWRYIRYNDGQEELYDHDNDPRELKNLADSPEYQKIKVKLNKEMQNLRKK